MPKHVNRVLPLTLTFNVRQHYRLKRQEEGVRLEKVEREHKEQEAQDERRLKEQDAPQIFNCDGTPGAILVSGSQHSSQGPFIYLWGLVTVMNPPPVPMKITPLRLLMAGEEWPVQSISFHLKSNTQDRSDRISLRGNDKEDYDLHFRFPDALRSRLIQGLVVQNPFRIGELGVKTLVEHLRGASVARRVDTGATMVTPDNMDEPEIRAVQESVTNYDFIDSVVPPFWTPSHN